MAVTKSMSSLYFAPLATTLALCAGCPTGDGDPAGDPRAISAIEAVNPTGTVTGQIVDLFTQAPIEGASVTLAHAAGEEGTTVETAADGTFELLEVSSSAAIGLLVEATGYASAWTTVNLPNSAGNLAQDNAVAFAGPLELLAHSVGVAPRFRVLTEEGESVTAASVQAILDVRFLDNGVAHGQIPGSSSYDAAVDAFVVSNIPDLAALAAALPTARVRAAIVPDDTTLDPAVVDLSVTEALSSGTYEVTVLSNVLVEDAGTPDVDLVEEDTALEIVGGNVADLIAPSYLGLAAGRVVLPTTLTGSDAIELVFSRPVEETSFFISIVDADEAALSPGPIIFSPSDELDSTVVTISEPAGGWPDGEEVNVLVEAISEAGLGPPQPPLIRRGSFLTPPAGALNILATGRLVAGNGTLACPDQAAFIELEVDAPIGNRANDGSAATSRDDVLAVRAVSPTAPVAGASPLGPDYAGTTPSTAELREVGNFLASGYSRQLRIPFNAAFGTASLVSQQLSLDLEVTLRFNDLETSSLNNTFGEAVIRSPGGAPVGDLTATVTVSTSNNGTACVF